MTKRDRQMYMRVLAGLALVGVVCGGFTLWQVWHIVMTYTPTWAKLVGAAIANLALIASWFGSKDWEEDED